jgi:hypothetical protein
MSLRLQLVLQRLSNSVISISEFLGSYSKIWLLGDHSKIGKTPTMSPEIQGKLKKLHERENYGVTNPTIRVQWRNNDQSSVEELAQREGLNARDSEERWRRD